MRRPQSIKRRVLVGVFILLVLLGVGFLSAVPPLVMGDMINQHVDFSTVYDAEAFGLTATELTLKTDD